MMRFKKTGLFAIGTLFFFASLHLQAATQYKIEDLGKIPDGANKAVKINNNGDYTIALINYFGRASTYLVSNGIKQEIGTVGFYNVNVNSLNDIKQATGSAIVDSFTNIRSAFLYSNGNLTNIETLDVNYSFGFDINNSGVSVGEASAPPLGYSKAFIHDSKTGQMVLLDDIAPVVELSPIDCYVGCWTLTRAFGINDQGMITGSAITPNNADDFPTSFYSKYRAFLLDGQILKSLGTLGGDFSIGQAINNNGHIAGVSDRYHTPWNAPFDPNPLISDPLHVFLYDGKRMNDLGSLDGGTLSIVDAMNNNDIVVGTVHIDRVEHAFISLRNEIIDLNTILSSSSEWTKLNRATDINDSGVIVGYGKINGETHGFKLAPIEKSEIACLHVSTEICTKILPKT